MTCLNCSRDMEADGNVWICMTCGFMFEVVR